MPKPKRIEINLGGAPVSPMTAQARLLCRYQVRQEAREPAEWILTVGVDDSGESMLLIQQVEWSSEGPDIVAWADRCACPEPEIWEHLLEAYLVALRDQRKFGRTSFSEITAPKQGNLPKKQVIAVFDRVFGE